MITPKNGWRVMLSEGFLTDLKVLAGVSKDFANISALLHDVPALDMAFE